MNKVKFVLCLSFMFILSCSTENSSDSKNDTDNSSDSSVDSNDTSGDTSSTDSGTYNDTSSTDSGDTSSDKDTACVPECGSAICGDNGCGGVCGTCSGNELCTSGVCEALEPGVVSVDGSALLNTIHSEIYGIAFGETADLNDLNVTLNRWGGNSTTRYNWELDVHNVGSDWYFENIADNGEGTYGTAGYMTTEEVFVRDTLATGATTLIAMPTIGWTPKDRVANHPFSCGFPATQYPSQDDFDEYDTNCGNGKSGDNDIAIDTDNALNTSKAAGPDYIKDRVTNLINKFGDTYGTRTHFYSLDNEMVLWNSTHRDVHPDPVDFAEVWEKTEQYAAAIKSGDPDAYVMGYGTWNAYDTLEANVEGESDTDHYGMPLMAWYLQKLAKYEKDNGVRLIDCVDLHFYPQQDANDDAQVLNSPKTLWDPDYVEESWLKWGFDNNVRLFSRVRDWIDQYYPGTEICLSEYNFFPDNPLSLLVQAEVFGILGREGIRLANWWTTPSDNGPYWAFRMFRNYDGGGSSFGDQVLSSASGVDNLTVFASKRSSDDKVTIMLINKNDTPQNITLNVTGIDGTSFTPWTKTVTGAAIDEGAAINTNANTLQVNIPPGSVLLLVED